MLYKEFIESVEARLEPVYGRPEGRAIAVRLLQHFCKISSYEHIVNPLGIIGEEFTVTLEKVVLELITARPLQYVLGFEEFCGRNFFVEEGILIPRPETEELVRWIFDDYKNTSCYPDRIRILDAACGSGCIGITLACEIVKSEVFALDLSEKAIEVTHRNAVELIKATKSLPANPFMVFKGDLLEGPDSQNIIERNSLDIIVSNPPYVRDSERAQMRSNVLEFEPTEALFVPDEDPLIFYKALVALGLKLLKPRGAIYLEVNESYGAEVVKLLQSSGFEEVNMRKDFRGKERMVKGIKQQDKLSNIKKTIVKKTFLLLAVFVSLSFASSAQTKEVNAHNIQPESPVVFPKQSNYLVNESRTPMYLPEVEGYVLLKADLHMHTIFSDGTIWPRTRVEEAFRDGLDVIAITDHLEFHYINQDKVNSKDLNMEYNIAKGLANELGILLIPGAEVTREVPAGHYNLLFLDDANKLQPFINPQNPRDTLTLAATLKAAKDLGCFITWNHPAYQNPRNIAEWSYIQQQLYSQGLMNGIEIVNSNMYIPLVQKWAMEKGLTMLSNSDSHSSMRFREGQHRPVTIIFAKERTMESVKEALFAGRTVGYSCNYLYGKEEFVKPMFQNSIKSRVLSATDKSVLVEFRNTSGIPYELEFLENGCLAPASTNKNLVIYPNETLAIKFTPKKDHIKSGEIAVRVNNIHVNAEQPLVTVIGYMGT